MTCMTCLAKALKGYQVEPHRTWFEVAPTSELESDAKISRCFQDGIPMLRHVPVCTCMRVRVCACVYTYWYIYIYICMYMCVCVCVCYREKFRSQTSDNMDTWKSRGAKNQRKGKKEDQRRERVGRKKMQVSRKKVEKSPNTVFFQWFVAPEGRKVGSLKQRVRSQLARWEMKNRTPLWREAHFQVKMLKTSQHRSTFGKCNLEKVHAVVARSTFPSQNVQNTSFGTI